MNWFSKIIKMIIDLDLPNDEIQKSKKDTKRNHSETTLKKNDLKVIEFDGKGSSKKVIKDIYKIQRDRLLEWRERYSKTEYPKKVVENIIYQSLQLEFLLNDFYKIFDKSVPKVDDFDIAYDLIMNFKSDAILSIKDKIDYTYQNRDLIGNFDLKAHRLMVKDAQNGDNEKLQKIEQSYIWYTGGVELIYYWAACGLIGLNYYQAASEVCDIIMGIQYNNLDDMQAMFGNNIILEYKPLKSFFETKKTKNNNINEENKHKKAMFYEFAVECNRQALIKINQGDFIGALKDFSHAIDTDPKYIESYINLGSLNFKLGIYNEAINNYNMVIKLDNKDAISYYNRGTAKNYLGIYHEAIEDYNIAIEINPKYDLAYCSRGLMKIYLNDKSSALKDFNKAIELNPKFVIAYNNRGNVNKELGNYLEAILDYNKAIELDPSNSDAYFNRGDIKDDLGQYLEAISDFNMTIKLEPNNADAYNNRGFSKRNLGNYEGAIKDYSKAIEINPNHHLAIKNRIKALEKLKNI